MKLSKLSMLSALLVTAGVNAYVNMDDIKGSLRNEFNRTPNDNLKNDFIYEAEVGVLKQAYKTSMFKRFALKHLSLKQLNKNLPDIDIINARIANAMAVDAAKAGAQKLVQIKDDQSKSTREKAAIIVIAAGKQAGKTYLAEKLVAAMYWTARKVEDKTGYRTVSALNEVAQFVEDNAVAQFVVDTAARSVADIVVNKGFDKFGPNANPANLGNSKGSKPVATDND